jgi:hypothetical protein
MTLPALTTRKGKAKGEKLNSRRLSAFIACHLVELAATLKLPTNG